MWVMLWLNAGLVLFFVVTQTQSTGYSDYKNVKQSKECPCGCMMGPAGPGGIPGVPGMHGQEGRKGDHGELGTKGYSGDFGPVGPVGPEGKKGSRGKKGTKGDFGPAGEMGPTGDQGERGHTGLPGEKGSKGEASKRNKKMAFSVVRSQRLGPVLQDTTVTFDTIVTNIGEGFDVYTSHFVCKSNATFVFMVHILGQNNVNAYAWLMLNDHHQVPLHGDGRAGYGAGSQSLILSLKADDHVWVQLNKDSGLLNDYTTFSGYMLFDDRD